MNKIGRREAMYRPSRRNAQELTNGILAAFVVAIVIGLVVASI